MWHYTRPRKKKNAAVFQCMQLRVLHSMFVRSPVRVASMLHGYGNGSWVTYCWKTGRTHVPRMAILARPVQLWPTTPENNGSQFFVNCHPIVLMDDLSYVWVHGKNFVASHWLDSTRWLLPPKGITGIYYLGCGAKLPFECLRKPWFAFMDGNCKTIFRFIRDMVSGQSSPSNHTQPTIN